MTVEEFKERYLNGTAPTTVGVLGTGTPVLDRLYFIDTDGNWVNTLKAGNIYMAYQVIVYEDGFIKRRDVPSPYPPTSFVSDSGVTYDKPYYLTGGGFIIRERQKAFNDPVFGFGYKSYYEVSADAPSGNVKFGDDTFRVIAADVAYKTVTVVDIEGPGSVVPSKSYVETENGMSSAVFNIFSAGLVEHSAVDSDGNELAVSDHSSVTGIDGQTIVIQPSNADDTEIHIVPQRSAIAVNQGDFIRPMRAGQRIIGKPITADSVKSLMTNWRYPVGLSTVKSFRFHFNITDTDAIESGDRQTWLSTPFDGYPAVTVYMSSDPVKKTGGVIDSVDGLPSTTYTDAVLVDLSLSDGKLFGTACSGCAFKRCEITGGSFEGCTFVSCKITGNAELTGCQLYATELQNFDGDHIHVCDMQQCYMHDSRTNNFDEFGHVEGCVFDHVLGKNVYIRSSSSDIYGRGTGGFKDYWMWVGVQSPEKPVSFYDNVVLRASVDYLQFLGTISSTADAEIVFQFDGPSGVDKIGMPYYVESEETKARAEYNKLITSDVQNALSKLYGKRRSQATDDFWISAYWNTLTTARMFVSDIVDMYRNAVGMVTVATSVGQDTFKDQYKAVINQSILTSKFVSENEARARQLSGKDDASLVIMYANGELDSLKSKLAGDRATMDNFKKVAAERAYASAIIAKEKLQRYLDDKKAEARAAAAEHQAMLDKEKAEFEAWLLRDFHKYLSGSIEELYYLYLSTKRKDIMYNQFNGTVTIANAGTETVCYSSESICRRADGVAYKTSSLYGGCASASTVVSTKCNASYTKADWSEGSTKIEFYGGEHEQALVYLTPSGSRNINKSNCTSWGTSRGKVYMQKCTYK